jgi:L-asparaginase / beta-aspartyl-peptidase
MASRFKQVAFMVGLAVIAVIFGGLWHSWQTASAAAAPHNPLSMQQSTAASAAIESVLSARQAAWNRGDIPAFLTGYWNSPDLTFAGSDGMVRGYDRLLARYNKSYPNQQAMGQLAFSDLEITPLAADAALVLGHWHIKRETGNIGGVFTLVFRQFPIGWRIMHDHTSIQK